MSETRMMELINENHQLRHQLEATEADRVKFHQRVVELESTIGKRFAPVRYAVVRFADDYPEEWRPPGLDGRWFDFEDMDEFFSLRDTPNTVARTLDAYESRQDGRIAQVYLISVTPEQAMKAPA